MDEEEALTARFEEHRPRLRAVARRMLGSASEAEDAVQDAWLRVVRAEPATVDNFAGFLTTVVARICLDMLRSRKSRREEPAELEPAPDAPATADREPPATPEQDTVLADSVGVALLVVLEALTPAERIAFVLHDLFDLPFEEIAGVLGTSAVSARQLASRARRRVRGAEPGADPDEACRRSVVQAFLTASRTGDLTGLVALLAPDAVLRADQVAVAESAARQAHGAPRLAPEIRGAAGVAEAFSGRARGARLALVDGVHGAVWAPGGVPRVVMDFTVRDGRVVAIDFIAEPEVLRELDVALVPPAAP